MNRNTSAVKRRPSVKQSKGNWLITLYLILYNTASAGAWGFLAKSVYDHLVPIIQEGKFPPNPHQLAALFSGTVILLGKVQMFAIMEIIHIITGLVPSQLLSTIIQISSRLFISWIAGVHVLKQGESLSTFSLYGYLLAVVAWTISDITRYLYYTTSLLGIKKGPLLWARYTFFLILYPMGTIGEIMMMDGLRELLENDLHTKAVIALIFVYPVGFLFMYFHMLKQRSRYLK